MKKFQQVESSLNKNPFSVYTEYITKIKIYGGNISHMQYDSRFGSNSASWSLKPWQRV